MPSALALIPARSGSQRVPGKNIRMLAGHPLIAYAIAAARLSEVFNRLIVSTDSDAIAEVARYYGAEVPFLRPAQFATATSPDIEWLTYTLDHLEGSYDCFSIVRPTSPFRSASMIQRAWQQFLSLPGIDSMRAVEPCRQHPGKMWVVEGSTMQPLLDQSHLDIRWHAGQYQALPKVYVQNSSLEIAWARVVRQHRSREGKVIAPFFTEGLEGFSIDYEHDWVLAHHFLETGQAVLPPVDREPFLIEQSPWSAST